MKMTRKIATALFIVFLIGTWTAYAGYTIYSNIIAETVSEYTFETLVKDSSPSILYTNVIFTGQLKLGGIESVGKEVYLLRNIGGEGWLKNMTTTTNSTGHFSFTVNRTSLGPIEYKAGFDVP